MTGAAQHLGLNERRKGPSPLVLHMAMARWQYAGAQAAFARFSAPQGARWPGARSAPLKDWTAQFGALPKEQVSAALAALCQQRLEYFLQGVERYQTDPYCRPSPKRQVAARFGRARLLDCGGSGSPVLLVPSLINPHWVLDLLPGNSFACALSGAGLRVFLLDWGRPEAAQTRYGLGEYVLRQLVPALKTVVERHGPAHLIGYCLGGNLALAAALASQACVRSFTAIATPWDFSKMGAVARALVRQTHEQLQPVVARTGVMPADALQGLFAQLDPTQIERKFNAFARLDPARPDHRKKMDHFIAVEDWSNSGPPLAAAAAHDCFVDFYQSNTPVACQWNVDGHAVAPGALACPALVLAALQDRIVPPASTLALASQLPNPTRLDVNAGHVGMMVGRNAARLCWQPVISWLQNL